MSDEEKKVSGLNFIITIPLKFSISAKEQIKQDFSLACANKGKTITKQLKESLCSGMGIESENDLYKLFSEDIREMKEKIKKRFKKSYKGDRDASFSEIFVEDHIDPFLNEDEKKRGANV